MPPVLASLSHPVRSFSLFVSTAVTLVSADDHLAQGEPEER
jgi:hypothetical protein